MHFDVFLNLEGYRKSNLKLIIKKSEMFKKKETGELKMSSIITNYTFDLSKQCMILKEQG